MVKESLSLIVESATMVAKTITAITVVSMCLIYLPILNDNRTKVKEMAIQLERGVRNLENSLATDAEISERLYGPGNRYPESYLKTLDPAYRKMLEEEGILKKSSP